MNRRTDLVLVNSGEWTRVARRRYWHISGAEINYDNNRWGWTTSVDRMLWPTLMDAAAAVERANG